MIQAMDVHWVMNFRTLKAFYKYCKRKNLNPDYYDIYDDLVNNGFTPEQALEIINISVKKWREHERNRYTE